MGFDGLGVNEHHQNGYGMMPSPNIMAAALARRTSRANLVVLGNSIALYNPPIRVAEEFAMLDVLSGGRLIAGFPVGTSMDTNFCYGETPALLREKYLEAHDLIIKAWTAKEMFSFNGKFTQLRYVNLWPRPLQQPHPPIWIPGGGSIETWEFCAKHDYQYSFLSFIGHLHGRRITDGYWETMSRLNKEPNPYSLGFVQTMAVAETDAEAERDLLAVHGLFLQPLPAYLRRLRRRARLSHARYHQVRHAQPVRAAEHERAELEGIRRRRLHHRGLAQNRARPSDRGGQDPALRPSDGAVAVRLDAV